MKRPVIFLAAALLFLAAVGYGPARVAWERHARAQARQARVFGGTPFIPNAATRGILSGADRVDTFRLAEESEDRDQSPEEQAALFGPHAQSLDDYAVLCVGPPQDRAFANALGTALAGTKEAAMTQCFDPGVGFRVWKGQAHVDLCVCFHCAGVEVITKDAHHRVVQEGRTDLGASRGAFLALSRRAFPDDKAIAAL